MTTSPGIPAEPSGTGGTGGTGSPTTISNIGAVMFVVADQDAALAFYTEKLSFEVRGGSRFGARGSRRWAASTWNPRRCATPVPR